MCFFFFSITRTLYRLRIYFTFRTFLHRLYVVQLEWIVAAPSRSRAWAIQRRLQHKSFCMSYVCVFFLVYKYNIRIALHVAYCRIYTMFVHLITSPLTRLYNTYIFWYNMAYSGVCSGFGGRTSDDDYKHDGDTANKMKPILKYNIIMCAVSALCNNSSLMMPYAFPLCPCKSKCLRCSDIYHTRSSRFYTTYRQHTQAAYKFFFWVILNE